VSKSDWGKRIAGALIAALLLFGAGCHRGEQQDEKSSAAPAPPRVLVVTLEKRSVPIFSTYPGQTVASQVVQLRPRVEGYLLDFSFAEGVLVNAGEPLFSIDPAPYQAALDKAQAARARALSEVERAHANVMKARADLAYALKQVDYIKAKASLTTALANLRKNDEDVARYRPLAKIQAIPEQTLDYALAAQSAARAEVSAARATVTNTYLKDQAEIARTRAEVSTAVANVSAAEAEVRAADSDIAEASLNLGYTRISSPTRGIIGKVNVNPGNLVGRGENTLLATIDAIDPMYVDFPIAEVEWLRLSEPTRRSGKKATPDFELLLADGSKYPHKGKFDMVERGISATTGTIMIRARFPNPQMRLRGGQFARVRVITDVKDHVLLVPQRAVVEFQALETVLCVGPDNKVLRKTITTGDRYNNEFVVTGGDLKEGDRVIWEGVQKARPGSLVTAENVPPPRPDKGR
jgi:membrane fusion protein (multidrug efflux system)